MFQSTDNKKTAIKSVENIMDYRQENSFHSQTSPQVKEDVEQKKSFLGEMHQNQQQEQRAFEQQQQQQQQFQYFSPFIQPIPGMVGAAGYQEVRRKLLVVACSGY